MECGNKIPFCRTRMMPCDQFGHEAQCPYFATCGEKSGAVPSLALVLKMYCEMCGGEETLTEHQRQVVRELRRFIRVMGITDEATADVVSFDSVDRYLAQLKVRNVSKIGIGYRLQSIFGRRARVFYRRRGYDVRAVDLPQIDDDSRAYRTISPARLMAVLKWYRELQFPPDNRPRTFALFMLKYAMRNGDVRRLRWRNIDTSGAGWRLTYTPHKTEKSTAGRTVSIWIDAMDQLELESLRNGAADDDFVIPRARYRRGNSLHILEKRMNAELRAIGFGGSKGLYELRKLCIDTVFHLHGAEAAAAYSGDDYKTVKFHYSDPSSLNLRGISDNAFGMMMTAGCKSPAA